MRDLGIPKLLSWRWAPCVALVLGSLCFVGFVTLAIPERIDGLLEGAGKASSLRLGSHLARSRTGTPESPADFAGENSSDSPAEGSAAPKPATRITQDLGDKYPRRGFTPPLDRPAPPPTTFTAPAPPPTEAAPPPPVPPPPALLPPPTPEPAAPQPDFAQAAAAAPAPAGPPPGE